MTINPDPRWNRRSAGASASQTGLSSTTEPLSVSALRASIPSAFLPALDERRSISRYLAYMVARGASRHSTTPFWNVLTRMRQQWLITVLVQVIEGIERGEHHEEQARWLANIDGGEAILRGIRAAASAIEAPSGVETAQTGSTEGESAAPAGGDAQPQVPSP